MRWVHAVSVNGSADEHGLPFVHGKCSGDIGKQQQLTGIIEGFTNVFGFEFTISDDLSAQLQEEHEHDILTTKTSVDEYLLCLLKTFFKALQTVEMVEANEELSISLDDLLIVADPAKHSVAVVHAAVQRLGKHGMLTKSLGFPNGVFLIAHATGFNNRRMLLEKASKRVVLISDGLAAIKKRCQAETSVIYDCL